MGNILNLGSLCIDYVYSVPAISGSGETIASTDRAVFPGGKGLNQSIAAARAGATVFHHGATGPDGELLLAALRDAGVDTGGVAVMDTPSGHAYIQVTPAGENAIVIHGGANRCIDAAMRSQAFSRVGGGDWVLLQNEINDVDAAMREAAASGANVALNLAPPDARIDAYPYELLALLILNTAEARALAGEDEPRDALRALAARYPNVTTVITSGGDGLIWYDRRETADPFLSLGAHVIEPVDETAAGDSFVGYLLAGLADGKALTDALQLASAAGALACTVAGAAPSVPAPDTVMALSGSADLPVTPWR